MGLENKGDKHDIPVCPAKYLQRKSRRVDREEVRVGFLDCKVGLSERRFLEVNIIIR